jgi:acyl-CoA thioester hydrolase
MVKNRPEQPYEGQFDGGAHRFALRVYFEDTDFSGVVYHANYLRFLERARSDMLRAAGVDQRRAFEAGVGVFAVAELGIRYRSPAKLDDALLIVSTITAIRAASCAIHQRVMRGEEILADADVVVAFVGPDGRPRRQPPAWIDAFNRARQGV